MIRTIVERCLVVVKTKIVFLKDLFTSTKKVSGFYLSSTFRYFCLFLCNCLFLYFCLCLFRSIIVFVFRSISVFVCLSNALSTYSNVIFTWRLFLKWDRLVLMNSSYFLYISQSLSVFVLMPVSFSFNSSLSLCLPLFLWLFLPEDYSWAWRGRCSWSPRTFSSWTLEARRSRPSKKFMQIKIKQGQLYWEKDNKWFLLFIKNIKNSDKNWSKILFAEMYCWARDCNIWAYIQTIF